MQPTIIAQDAWTYIENGQPLRAVVYLLPSSFPFRLLCTPILFLLNSCNIYFLTQIEEKQNKTKNKDNKVLMPTLFPLFSAPPPPSHVQVRLQLWDIAGQDRFAKLTRAYFRKAKGAVVVCDVTREGTFDAIVRWKVRRAN